VYGPKTALNIGRLFLLINIFGFIYLFIAGWISIQFFIFSALYTFFSLGLLIKFLKIDIPKSIEVTLEDYIIPVWGFGFLIAIVFYIALKARAMYY
jgi:hypothetical protein